MDNKTYDEFGKQLMSDFVVLTESMYLWFGRKRTAELLDAYRLDILDRAPMKFPGLDPKGVIDDQE